MGIAVAYLTLAALALNSAASPAFRPDWIPGSSSSPGDPAAFDPITTVAGNPASPSSPAKPPAGALPVSAALRELRAGGSAAPALALTSGGTIGTVTAAPGRDLGPSSDAFVKRYAAALGTTDAHTLARTESKSFGTGSAQRYQQQAGGLPVIGGEVVVMSGAKGAVLSAIAQTTSLKPVGAAKISAEAARAAGLAAAQKKFEFADGEVKGVEAKLWLLDPALIGLGGSGQLRPTYWVKLTGEDSDELASVLVDAIDGGVRLVASEHRAAQSRIVCDLANRSVNLSSRAQFACYDGSTLGAQSTTRVEGGAASSVADVNSAYDALAVAYKFYKDTFGRDSFNANGSQIRATVRACDPRYACPYQNAFYGGGQFVFGQGWARDDIVWHEFTHAVTDYASSLFYWQQSGAINEALSDIFGELIDLSNSGDGSDDVTKRWLISENSPLGVLRNMADPPAMSDPAYLEENGLWDVDPDLSDNGGVHTNSGVANKSAFLIADGGSLNGQTVTGIGLAKSAQLWYRVMHMLPSGAKYYQLGQTLSAVCRTLIGHLGFTAADCVNGVDRAVAATWMLGPPSGMDPSQARIPACLGDITLWPSPAWPEDTGEPSVDLFFDDMEKQSTKWVASSGYYWQQIPNTDISYSYAGAGRGSINGWTLPGQTGHGSYIEMAQPVTLPVGKTPFVHFKHSMDKDPAGGIAVFVQANGGAWQPLTAPYAGTILANGEIVYPSRGYGSTKIRLDGYAGQSVKLRFQINDPGNVFLDWYFDDFRIGYCDNLTGAPAEGYGFPTTGGLSLNWAAPKFVSKSSSGPAMSYQWELSYSPAIAGAPATVPQGTTSLLLANADPSQRYEITIRARLADGRAGADRLVVVTSGPPVACPTKRPTSLQLPMLGRRPIPGVPAGACTRPFVPIVRR